MSEAYPYFTIARETGIPYAEVLKKAEYLENNPMALDYWLGLPAGEYYNKNIDVHALVAPAVQRELLRRDDIEMQRRVPQG